MNKINWHSVFIFLGLLAFWVFVVMFVSGCSSQLESKPVVYGQYQYYEIIQKDGRYVVEINKKTIQVTDLASYVDFRGFTLSTKQEPQLFASSMSIYQAQTPITFKPSHKYAAMKGETK